MSYLRKIYNINHRALTDIYLINKRRKTPISATLLTFSCLPDVFVSVSRDAVVVSCINCATSVGGGFVIFSVIGFMAHTLNREVAQVVSSGKITS